MPSMAQYLKPIEGFFHGIWAGIHRHLVEIHPAIMAIYTRIAYGDVWCRHHECLAGVSHHAMGVHIDTYSTSYPLPTQCHMGPPYFLLDVYWIQYSTTTCLRDV